MNFVFIYTRLIIYLIIQDKLCIYTGKVLYLFIQDNLCIYLYKINYVIIYGNLLDFIVINSKLCFCLEIFFISYNYYCKINYNLFI